MMGQTDRGSPRLESLARDTATPGAIAASMNELLAAKRRTIGPLLGVSLALFVIVLLLAGFARPLMATPVLGAFNLGYAMIVGLYVMCWVVGIVYVSIADRVFDPEAAAIAARLGRQGSAGQPGSMGQGSVR